MTSPTNAYVLVSILIREKDSKCNRMVQKDRSKKFISIFHVWYWRFLSVDTRRISKQRNKISRRVEISSTDREII